METSPFTRNNGAKDWQIIIYVLINYILKYQLQTLWGGNFCWGEPPLLCTKPSALLTSFLSGETERFAAGEVSQVLTLYEAY